MKTLQLSLSVVLLQCVAVTGSQALDKGEPHSLTRANWCAEALKECKEIVPEKNCSDIPTAELDKKMACYETFTKICEETYGSGSKCMSETDPQ